MNFQELFLCTCEQIEVIFIFGQGATHKDGSNRLKEEARARKEKEKQIKWATQWAQRRGDCLIQIEFGDHLNEPTNAKSRRKILLVSDSENVAKSKWYLSGSVHVFLIWHRLWICPFVVVGEIDEMLCFWSIGFLLCIFDFCLYSPAMHLMFVQFL